jgi:hypothetical protein
MASMPDIPQDADLRHTDSDAPAGSAALIYGSERRCQPAPSHPIQSPGIADDTFFPISNILGLEDPEGMANIIWVAVIGGGLSLFSQRRVEQSASSAPALAGRRES